MKKKLFSLFLFFALILSLSIPAFAAEPSDEPSQQLSGPEWDYLTLGEDYYLDENGNVIYTYEQEEVVTCAYTDSETRAVQQVDFIVNVLYGYDLTTKKSTFVANIDCPDMPIFKPNISISMKLKKADSKNGLYSTAVKMTPIQPVDYLANYKIEYGGTNHYKFYVYLYSNDPNLVISKASTSFYTCRNRTGNLWKFYHVDPHSGVTIAEPDTNWVVDEQKRPSNLNSTYQKKYNAAYGTNIVVGKDVGIDVHHVRPLKFGGSNDMTNLVHINHNFHTQITGWFQGY